MDELKENDEKAGETIVKVALSLSDKERKMILNSGPIVIGIAS
jgi:hypothetical protein